MGIIYNAIHDVIHNADYGPREDYGILRKKGVMTVYRYNYSFLEMIDGATFRNGEIQPLVTLEWHAMRLRPNYRSNQ